MNTMRKSTVMLYMKYVRQSSVMPLNQSLTNKTIPCAHDEISGILHIETSNISSVYKKKRNYFRKRNTRF